MFNTLKTQVELSPTQIHFWRTKDQAEVDFVLETGLEVTPIEVKYTKLSKLEITRSLRSFLTKYKPTKGYIVHSGGEEGREIVKNTTLQLLPYTKLIFQRAH